MIALTKIGRSSIHRVISAKKSSFSSLSSLISREIAEEKKVNPLEMPQELMDLKETLSTKWDIVDGSDTGGSGATIKMFKRTPISSGGKVTISFHCQDSMPEEEMFDEEDLEEELAPSLRFDVSVSKAGKYMHISCVNQDARATVDGIVFSDSADEINEDFYRGPVLDDLPDDVREALDEYIQVECGVDEDVAAFTSMYADYREQAEYMQWLNDVKSIVG